MKMNNKGMTLMELLVSIVLVGIVLTFLFQLLTDLEHETENNNYAYNNQVNRTDVIYTIEKDLQKYTLVGIEDASTTNELIINFHYLKSGGTYVATLQSETKTYKDEIGDNKVKYYLKYKNYNGEDYYWEMKGAELDLCATLNYYVDSNSNNYYFKINIPIYNDIYHDKNNKDRNNAVDDIEIIFASDKNDLITTNGDFLIQKIGEQRESKIGICTN